MRFSAIAREIQTTAQNKVGFPLLKRQISTQFSALKHAVSGPMKIKVVVPVLPTTVEGKNKAKLGMARESDGFVMVEQELEVVEEDEEGDSEDEKDWLVEHLFEQLKEYKTMVSLARPTLHIAHDSALRVRDAQRGNRGGDP